jgi:hypothetical protein
MKRDALYGRYHATCADFQAALQETLDKWLTEHKDKPASLRTLNFQEFDDDSLLSA